MRFCIFINTEINELLCFVRLNGNRPYNGFCTDWKNVHMLYDRLMPLVIMGPN